MEAPETAPLFRARLPPAGGPATVATRRGRSAIDPLYQYVFGRMFGLKAALVPADT